MAVEIEISEWIPEIFKGEVARLDWQNSTYEREEVENATHISGLGNGVGWENPEEVKVGREKQADLEQLSLNSMKCL